MIKFKLREAMDNTHMNIEQLHEASGISRNTISLLLHGKMKGIRLNTIDSLATAFEELGAFIDDKLKDVQDAIDSQMKKYLK